MMKFILGHTELDGPAVPWWRCVLHQRPWFWLTGQGGALCVDAAGTSKRRRSAGTLSPTDRQTVSPGTSSLASRCSRLPSLTLRNGEINVRQTPDGTRADVEAGEAGDASASLFWLR